MNKDQDDLLTALGVTAEVCGTQLSEGAALVMVQSLAKYPTAEVLRALARCAEELTGRLSLAAILERIDTGHPGAEQAWAMFPKTESESAIVTEQMMAAAAVAIPLYEEGDHVGARMAWKEIYPRLVAQSTEPPRWVATLGTDKSGRVACLTEGVRRGQISGSEAMAKLGGAQPSEELLELTASPAPQIEGPKVNKLTLEEQRAKIAGMIDFLKGRTATP